MTDFKFMSAATPTPTPASTRILPALPLELREKIYHHAFIPLSSRANPNCVTVTVTVTVTDAIHGSDARYPCFLPSICRINEATRLDIGTWFIRNTEFSILNTQHTVYFSQFLLTFPHNQGFTSIRWLDFPLFGRYKPIPGHDNAYIEFMKRCPEMTGVRFKFEIWYLLRHGLGKWIPQDAEMMLLEDVASFFGLDALFDLKSLMTLTIEVWPKAVAWTSRGAEVMLPDCWNDMKKLVEWLRKGFEQRGIKVDVRLVETGNVGLRCDGAVERLGMGV